MFNFFSNNVIYVDGENTEKVVYPKAKDEEERPPKQFFYVPSHTIDTQNLLIFLDGNIQIKDRDYEDANSDYIKFKKNIYFNQDVVAILIKGSTQLEWGYF